MHKPSQLCVNKWAFFHTPSYPTGASYFYISWVKVRWLMKRLFLALNARPGWPMCLYTELRWRGFTFLSDPSLNTCMAETSMLTCVSWYPTCFKSHFLRYPVFSDLSYCFCSLGICCTHTESFSAKFIFQTRWEDLNPSLFLFFFKGVYLHLRSFSFFFNQSLPPKTEATIHTN